MALASMYHVATHNYHKYLIPEQVSVVQYSTGSMLMLNIFFCSPVNICTNLCHFHRRYHVLHADHMVQHAPFHYSGHCLLAISGVCVCVACPRLLNILPKK